MYSRTTLLFVISLTGIYLPGIAQSPQRFDILIDELFPDPSPVMHLPEAEFIELKNVAGHAFNLQYWQLTDGTTTATIRDSVYLKPDSFVVICPNNAVAAFEALGNMRVIGVSSFPTLNNTGDQVSLLSPDGRTIHTVHYTTSWYNNTIKQDGGWTLEMIDPGNPCKGASNWTASQNANGGTPGFPNSVDHHEPDNQPPSLDYSYTIDDQHLVAVFDEALDSGTAANPSFYTLDQIGEPLMAMPAGPDFTAVTLTFSTSMQPDVLYTLQVEQVQDCAGNPVRSDHTVKTALPQPVRAQDVVINELLFNPASGGYDYVELFNRSQKAISLQQLYLAGRDNTGILESITPLQQDARLFFPGEYRVYTQNKNWLLQNYMVRNPLWITETSKLPSLPDDAGNIVLIDIDEAVIDEVAYNKDWHFALINNEEGVALERIRYDEPAQNPGNWTSAASTTGYGTPTYQNSQLGGQQVQALFEITPAVFSPDNDGFRDYTEIQYQLTEPGYMLAITIYNINGIAVRQLVKNAIAGTSGRFTWDGLGEQRQALPTGPYVVVANLFNPTGKTQKIKKVVTLAGR